MALPSVFNTGRSGMVASKAAIATSGHNIANAKTEGASRQRVQTEAGLPQAGTGKNYVGTGVNISRVERVNDEYIEKQIRNNGRDLASMEEKDLILHQSEDIFNEMGGEGLNRLISRTFNEFRKLSNDPDSEAVRQSVREATKSMVNDFHRLRTEVTEVQNHIDARLAGNVSDLNSTAHELGELNYKIQQMSLGGTPVNDLMDRRDVVMKKLASFADVTMHMDKEGNYNVDLKGVGPLVYSNHVETFGTVRSKGDDEGKPTNGLDVTTTASVSSIVTHRIKGGTIGSLLESRDQLLSTVQSRLDELAYAMSTAVNEIHEQGFTRNGTQGVSYFKKLDSKDRAAELIDLSDEVSASVNNIATAMDANSPGDNRVAIALSGLQHARLLGENRSTMDDYYNSIVSDIGVASESNKSSMTQQRDIMNQLGKIREQISGVSIDEETANIMQYQQAFAANARVIQVADEMLKEVLDLRRG
jgi:flagellar hook-associated protein 1 FlgK